MPRKNLNERTTLKTCTDHYDHTANYKSCKTESAYVSKENLIFWSDFCGSPQAATKALNGYSYRQVAFDRSTDATSLKVFGPQNKQTTTGTTVVREDNVIEALQYFPGSFKDLINSVAVDMCGNPCFWLNLSNPNPDRVESCRGTAYGANHLLIEPNSALNFSNDGATQDEPFSISVWYYPIDKAENTLSVYDRGGVNRLQSPAIFHKTFQYGLFQRECGKLEFVLYDISLSASVDNTNPKDPEYDLNATSATLAVRSAENVFTPGAWNHITVTYDGSATRDGMKIYVNCVDRTNRNDDPPSYSSSLRTTSLTNGNNGQFQVSWSNFLNVLYSAAAADQENPAHYTAMHSFNTPLVFAATAMAFDAQDIINLNQTGMQPVPNTQLPSGFIFDIAIWNASLNSENVDAVCDATRNCMQSFTHQFGGDSGYINLSPKIMKDIKDEKDNALSVIDRIGDRSDRRVKSRPPYNDQHTVVFGRRLTDELKKGSFRYATLIVSDGDVSFGVPGVGIIPDKKNWEVVNASIKREERPSGLPGVRLRDNALTFGANPGISSISTVESFNNVIMYYDLILGPYNQSASLLNLFPASKDGASLTISVSTDNGTSYQVVKTHTVSGGSAESQEQFYSVDGIKLTPVQHKFRKSFSLHFKDINTGGLPYKIKFESADRCWGIGRIDIISSNEEVRNPILINHDSFIGSKIDSDFIATPHTASDLTSINKSVKGITDSYILFNDKETQKIEPFDDDESLPFAGNSFFDFGVSSDILPGFSSPLKDKTSFTIILSSSAETDIGITNKTNGIDEIGGGGEAENQTTLNTGHKITATWNNKTQKFQALDRGYMAVLSATQRDQSIRDFNKVPFSSIDIIATASNISGVETVQFGPEFLSSYAQPVTSFGFPTHSSYTLPEEDIDGLIDMSDYINKPFALEKVVVEFDARFEFAGSDSESATGARGGHRALFSKNNDFGGSNYPSFRSTDSNVVLIPSFYLLKVNRNSSKLFSQDYLIDDEGRLDFTGSIDSTAKYDSIGLDFTSCDLISYGQMTLFMTGSGSTTIDMQKALDEGLGRDAIYDIRELNGDHTTANSWLTSGISPITSSFKIEFPVRAMPKTDFTSRTYYKTSDDDFFTMFGSSKSGGRSVPVITGSDGSNPGLMPTISNRGLINNLGSVNSRDRKVKNFADSDGLELPYPVQTSGFLIENEKTSISPYVLFPEDKMSVNFSYPVPARGVFTIPGSTDKRLNKMTLHGITKIHLFGSAIKNNAEFHENMNQALTTREITEPVGCEAVVDQYTINPRDEYYKTYIDRDPLFFWNYKLSASTLTYERLFSVKNIMVKGPSLFSNALLTGSMNFNTDGKNPNRVGVLRPHERIGLHNGSAVNKWKSYELVVTNLVDSTVGSSSTFNHFRVLTDPKTQPLKGTPEPSGLESSRDPSRNSSHSWRKTFTFPFVELYDNLRRYADTGPEGVRLGIDNVLGIQTSVTKKTLFGSLQQNEARSKYVFRHDHYGYYADMLSSAKDSSYQNFTLAGQDLKYGDVNLGMSVPTATFSTAFNSSPISIKFVSGSSGPDNNRQFHQISTSQVSDDTINKSPSSIITTSFRDDSSIAQNWNSGLD
jgi:hypothetical protein